MILNANQQTSVTQCDMTAWHLRIQTCTGCVVRFRFVLCYWKLYLYIT